MVAVDGDGLMRHFFDGAAVEADAPCDVDVLSEAGPEIALVETVDVEQVAAPKTEIAADEVACGAL